MPTRSVFGILTSGAGAAMGLQITKSVVDVSTGMTKKRRRKSKRRKSRKR